MRHVQSDDDVYDDDEHEGSDDADNGDDDNVDAAQAKDPRG